MTFCNAFSNEQKRLSNAIAGCVFHLLLLLQLLFLLLLLLFAVCWTTCPCEMAFAFGQRKSTVAAGNRSSKATEAARQQRGQLRQQHFTSMQAQTKVRHTLRRLAYAPPERVCVCECVFVCIDVIPSSDIQIILSSGRSHKATTNSKCKKYFKSEQHMCNTLHATLLTINRAGRDCERVRESTHVCCHVFAF